MTCSGSITDYPEVPLRNVRIDDYSPSPFTEQPQPFSPVIGDTGHASANIAPMHTDFPDDENGDVLRRMQQNGDDFTKARDVDFSVVFPSDTAAQEFADHFRRLGFKASVCESNCDKARPWDVTVTKHMLPSHAGITEFEETLQTDASPLAGRNDGWGCFRQPVKQD